ncbi:very short patch repair endonuclease [Brevibacillus borstelensis]|uniref:very short patch repair endonuclease n=1 Tax=Brevibacillus borstelensis TaxID=45462 RepID=UPI003D20A3B9
MADRLSKEQRSKLMQAVKGKNTLLESKVTKELWHKGLRFRKNVKSLTGKPDVAIKKYKIVMFIDSCFWHGCPLHCKIPKSNVEYWTSKIQRNIQRDLEVNEYYKKIGWNVIRIWEHELKNDFQGTIDKIVLKIKEKTQVD